MVWLSWHHLYHSSFLFQITRIPELSISPGKGPGPPFTPGERFGFSSLFPWTITDLLLSKLFLLVLQLLNKNHEAQGKVGMFPLFNPQFRNVFFKTRGCCHLNMESVAVFWPPGLAQPGDAQPGISTATKIIVSWATKASERFMMGFSYNFVCFGPKCFCQRGFVSKHNFFLASRDCNFFKLGYEIFWLKICWWSQSSWQKNSYFLLCFSGKKSWILGKSKWAELFWYLILLLKLQINYFSNFIQKHAMTNSSTSLFFWKLVHQRLEKIYAKFFG